MPKYKSNLKPKKYECKKKKIHLYELNLMPCKDSIKISHFENVAVKLECSRQL